MGGISTANQSKALSQSTYLVTRHHPSALGNQLGGLLVNGLLSGGNLIDGKLLEWSGLLNVLEGGGKILQLQVHGLLGGLGVLDGLDLEGVNGLDLAADIVGGGLEGLEALLDLVNDGLVLQDGAVLGEVDGGGLLRQLLDLAAGILVALLEGLEGGDGLAAEAQGRGDLDPVELESCASLFDEKMKISSWVFPRVILRIGSGRNSSSVAVISVRCWIS